MNREERAKQFMPFDALKGLSKALRMKEYEHERRQKGDISEEQALSLSKKILSLKKGDVAEVKYFYDGYMQNEKGVVKAEIEFRKLIINEKVLNFDDIFEISVQKH